MYTFNGIGICIVVIAFGLKVVIISTVISPGVIAQSLHSTLLNGRFACPGSEFIFNCTTRDSSAISWISDEYIGPSELIFVASSDSQGDRQSSRSNPETVATLTRREGDQGTTVLESTLRIIASAEPQNASVTCAHTDSGGRAVATFQVIGVPAKPENVVAVQIQHTKGRCVVHSLWDWQNNDIKIEYKISANEMEMSRVNTSTVETTNRTMVSALFPIECAAHVISVRASNVCGRSPASPNLTLASTPLYTLTEFEPETATDPSEIVTTDGDAAMETTNPNFRPSPDLTLPIVTVMFVVVFLIQLLIIIALLAFIGYRCHQDKDKNKAVSDVGTGQGDVDMSEKTELQKDATDSNTLGT